MCKYFFSKIIYMPPYETIWPWLLPLLPDIGHGPTKICIPLKLPEKLDVYLMTNNIYLVFRTTLTKFYLNHNEYLLD